MLMIPRFLAIIALAAPALLSPAIAQIRFEVASIRPSRPGAGPQDGQSSFGGNLMGKAPSNRFDAEASTVGDILDMLNGWQLFHVVGGPAWMRTDRYDIHAKAGAPIPLRKSGRTRSLRSYRLRRYHRMALTAQL